MIPTSQLNKQSTDVNQDSQTADIKILIGDFKQENVTFNMETSFKFDTNLLEQISQQICKSINQTEEIFNNKVVIKIDVINNKSKSDIAQMMKKLVELQKINKKVSVFSLLNTEIKIYESVNENSIYLITNFVDDIHIMLDDVKKIFCNSKSKYSDSFLEFQLSINNNFTDQNKETQSSLYQLMQSSFFRLKILLDRKCNNQLFNVLGISQDQSLKLILQKMKNINMNLKFKTFEEVPNKSDFMNWLFQLQKARYTIEEIQILQQITNCISDNINFYSIFRDSNTSIIIQTNQKGLFQYIQEYK